jgi:hypothetical protein
MPVPTKNTQVHKICDRLNTLRDASRRFPINALFRDGANISLSDALSTDVGQQAKEAFKPELETMKWDSIPGDATRKRDFRDTYEALAISMMQKIVTAPRQAMEDQIEKAHDIGLIETVATGTPGVGLFTRQLIVVVKRAVPQLFAPQIVPVKPLNGPSGRIYWMDRLYGSAYASSSPSVSAGDNIADMSKLNKDYANMDAKEGLTAQELKLDISSYITVESSEHRVYGEFTNVADIDYADQFAGEVGLGSLEMVMKWNLADFLVRVIDKNVLYMIRNGIAAFGSNTKFYDRDPTIGGTGWTSQLPSERQAYRESLWGDGIAPVFTAIAQNNLSRPTVAIAGPTAAEELQKANQVRIVGNVLDGGSMGMGTKNFQFLGGMDANRVAVFVDYTQSVPDGEIYFGGLPQNPMDPAMYFCPRTPIAFFKAFTDPTTGNTSNGAWTTFGLGGPQSGTAASSILARGWGNLITS